MNIIKIRMIAVITILLGLLSLSTMAFGLPNMEKINYISCAKSGYFGKFELINLNKEDNKMVKIKSGSTDLTYIAFDVTVSLKKITFVYPFDLRKYSIEFESVEKSDDGSTTYSGTLVNYFEEQGESKSGPDEIDETTYVSDCVVE